MDVDRKLMIALVVIALAFLFMLPPYTRVKPKLNITSASLSNSSLNFEIEYAAPWPKSCFIVVYGPFQFDRAGHEEGNNIYVLTQRVGKIQDTLRLQNGKTLEKLKVELWCDWNKLKEAEKELT